MRTASAAFAAALTGPHDIAVRCDVLFNREVIAEDIPIESGTARFDRRNSIQGSLDIVLADPTRVPVASDDVLTPYGYELRVWRGIDYSRTEVIPVVSDPEQYTLEDGTTLVTLEDGTTAYTLEAGAVTAAGNPAGPELLPLGTFPIQQSFVQGRTLLSEIVAEDRGRLVADARFEDVYSIENGVDYVEALQEMISDGVPDLEFVFPDLDFTAPLLTFDRFTDRWSAARRMAESIGYELYFDGLGVCRMRPEPTFSATPDVTIATGQNLTDATVALDRAPAFNKVVAIGNNPSTNAEFVGEAVDDDPSSPTFYGPGFGFKPRTYYSPFIASTEQAESAAAAVLASNLGVARSVDVSAVPDPRIEPADVALVEYPALGLDGVHIVDAVEIGLTADAPLTMHVRANRSSS